MIHCLFKNRLLLVILTFYFITAFVFNFGNQTEQQFSHLANSFLNGKLYFLSMPGSSWADTTPFGGHFYWPLGPLPAILMFPFVVISRLSGLPVYHGYLNFILSISIFYLVYKLSLKMKYSAQEGLYFSTAFCFGSTLIGSIFNPWGWYFTHTIVVFFLLLAILEYLNKRRLIMIGFFVSAAIATRLTVLPILSFFLGSILFANYSVKVKVTSLSKLLIFPLITLLLLGLYNYLRFGNFLETGYSWQILPRVHELARNYGLTNIRHIPGNLYYLLLAPPIPVLSDGFTRVLKFPLIKADHWGMSIFLTSPYLFYLFLFKYKGRVSINLILTILLTLVPILLWFGVGYRQFGYRFSADFFPLLFFLFLKNYKEKYATMGAKLKTLIVLSSLVNYYLFFTFISFT